MLLNEKLSGRQSYRVFMTYIICVEHSKVVQTFHLKQQVSTSTKVMGVYHLGTRNVCTMFKANPSSTC